MTVKELQKKKEYRFDCYITKRRVLKEIVDADFFDEWGCAIISFGNRVIVEYNFCVDNTADESINSSAIYKVCYYEEQGKWFSEIDTSNYIHYEIDFSNCKWKKELERAMCEALIKLFNL